MNLTTATIVIDFGRKPMVKSVENYIATGNTVLVEARAVKESEGGIILAEESIDNSYFEVLSLGKLFDCEDVDVGDTLIISGKYKGLGGTRVDLGVGKYWIYPVQLIAAKIVNDDVVPRNKYLTLEYQKPEGHKESGGIVYNEENNENPLLYLKVLNVGNECVDLVKGDTAVIETDKCIPVNTKNGKVFLTSELVVLAKAEDK
jgi:hypothetical protein